MYKNIQFLSYVDHLVGKIINTLKEEKLSGVEFELFDKIKELK